LRDKGAGVVPRIIAELHHRLAAGGIEGAVVSGREKAAYSIWRAGSAKPTSSGSRSGK